MTSDAASRRLAPCPPLPPPSQQRKSLVDLALPSKKPLFCYLTPALLPQYAEQGAAA